MTMITKLAYGSEPLAYLKTSWKKGEAKKDAQKRLWDTPVQSKSRRPWTHHMLYRFLSCMRKFKSWMHSSIDPATGARRNWCPPTEIVLPDEPKLVAGNIGDDVTAGKIMDRARCSACRPGHSNMPRGCATGQETGNSREHGKTWLV